MIIFAIMFMRYHIFNIIVCLSGLLLLESCHSKRAVTTPTAVVKVKGEKIPVAPSGAKPDADNIMSHQKRLVDEAMTWLGTPYRYGGNDKSGVDCSGLTTQVYMKALGIALPRNSAQQQAFCNNIPFEQIKIGDLVFFVTGSNKSRVSHVGMYIGNGYIIHASGSKGVILSQLSENYYKRTYHSSGHVGALDKFNAKKDKPKKTNKEIPFDKLPAPKRLETEPLKFEIKSDIEQTHDSVMTVFLD